MDPEVIGGRILFWIVPAAGDTCLIAACHIACEGVAYDDGFLFFKIGNLLKAAGKKTGRRFFTAQFF